MFHPKITSFFIIINIYHSIINDLMLMATLQTIVLISSIIYHHNLIEEFRNYDICIACSITSYHFYIYSYYLIDDFKPCIFYILAISSYFIGVEKNNDYMHGYLHIFGIIVNILLNLSIVSNTNLLNIS
jgi:hypothetical protein